VPPRLESFGNIGERIMDLRRALIAAAIITLAGGSAAGCGQDCEDLCEDQRACSDAPAAGEEGDCAIRCEDARALAQIADCDDPYDDYLDCATDVDDVCSPGDACGAEERAYSSCIVAFCSEQPDDPACFAAPGG
jgi:hypothetical protein